jgi:putative transposase
MPWKEVTLMDQRNKFIEMFSKQEHSFAYLCRYFNISRPTGYKWIARHEQRGLLGLIDQSKAPHKQPRAIENVIEDFILSIKFSWPKWGAKKILAHLKNHYIKDIVKIPCKTSIENILKRNGLVESRKIIRRLAACNDSLTKCHQSNDLWCIDFKGWSMTADGYRYGPFTVMDADSRFLLSCVHLNCNDTEHVWAILENNFYAYGLPKRVRSDNGPPFASLAPGRFSTFSIRLIKAGVIPEWIEPGHPEQNGRHERMHSTLQSECISNEYTLSEQIQRLQEFLTDYNFNRPHEALDQRCPGHVYVCSERNWNGRLRSPEYSNEYKIGKVKSCGKMSWEGREVYISRVFEGEPIGIREEEKGYTAYYGPIRLGIMQGNTLNFERHSSRRNRK